MILKSMLLFQHWTGIMVWKWLWGKCCSSLVYMKFVTNSERNWHLVLKQGCCFFFYSKLAKLCFFVKGRIKEKNIDKMKLKMKTKFKHGRDLHRPSAKQTMQQNLWSGEADSKICWRIKTQPVFSHLAQICIFFQPVGLVKLIKRAFFLLLRHSLTYREEFGVWKSCFIISSQEQSPRN